MTRLFAFLACLMVVSGAAEASEVHYAIIQLDGAGHGLFITDAPLASRDSVDIQYPVDKQGTACCKRLTSADFSKARVKTCWPLTR